MKRTNTDDPCLCLNNTLLTRAVYEEQVLENSVIRSRLCPECDKMDITIENSLAWEKKKQAMLKAMIDQIQADLKSANEIAEQIMDLTNDLAGR